MAVLYCSQGKFTSKDGRVFEGELTYDQMMTHNLNDNGAPVPLCGKHLQYFQKRSAAIKIVNSVTVQCLPFFFICSSSVR